MNRAARKVQNPVYLWASRGAFWLTLCVTIPVFFMHTHIGGTKVVNTLTLMFHIYVAVANYVLGYRIDAPPAWSAMIIPAKWIAEWRHLIYSSPEAIKSNRLGLLRVIAGSILLTVLLLATVSGRI